VPCRVLLWASVSAGALVAHKAECKGVERRAHNGKRISPSITERCFVISLERVSTVMYKNKRLDSFLAGRPIQAYWLS
jgi:hypothetical protein